MLRKQLVLISCRYFDAQNWWNNKKGQIIRLFFLFLVPYIRFLFESLQLIRQFSPRFDQISGCSKLLKYFNIFQKFLRRSKFYLFHTNVSYFSTLHQKSFFFNKTNSCSRSNWLKCYIKILNLILSAALFYRSGGVRNYFLYKAPIYLPTENIKFFGQNGWSVHTWEPYVARCFMN